MSRKLIKNLAKTSEVKPESSSEEEEYVTQRNKFSNL